jgi:hypothetical protein
MVRGLSQLTFATKSALLRHTYLPAVRLLSGVKQKSLFEAVRAAFDPDVWSGRALQEDFVELTVSGLASMYPASDWSICSGPSWISARVRSH